MVKLDLELIFLRKKRLMSTHLAEEEKSSTKTHICHHQRDVLSSP